MFKSRCEEVSAAILSATCPWVLTPTPPHFSAFLALEVGCQLRDAEFLIPGCYFSPFFIVFSLFLFLLCFLLISLVPIRRGLGSSCQSQCCWSQLLLHAALHLPSLPLRCNSSECFTLLTPFSRQPSWREFCKMAPQIMITINQMLFSFCSSMAVSGMACKPLKNSLEKPSSNSLSHPDILKTTGCLTFDTFWHPDYFVAIFWCVI